DVPGAHPAEGPARCLAAGGAGRACRGRCAVADRGLREPQGAALRRGIAAITTEAVGIAAAPRSEAAGVRGPEGYPPSSRRCARLAGDTEGAPQSGAQIM